MKFATSLLLASATAAVKLESQATGVTTIWDLMTEKGTDLSSEGSVKVENMKKVFKQA